MSPRSRASRWSVVAACALVLLMNATAADAQLFRADSKGLAGGEMDIVVREVERRARTSVVHVTFPGAVIDLDALGPLCDAMK